MLITSFSGTPSDFNGPTHYITSSFEIPAGSFGFFTVVAVALWIVLYDNVILPLASRIMGRPARLTAIQRTGIGIFLSTSSMVVTAIVESVRRGIAINESFDQAKRGCPHVGYVASTAVLRSRFFLGTKCRSPK